MWINKILFIEYKLEFDYINLMATLKSTDESFDNLIKENKIVLTDFWASWCGPCLQIAPILEELSDELKDKGVVIAKHNMI